MAINWKFNADEVELSDFSPIPIGDYRVRISSATAKVSKSGNDMIEVVLDVSGQNGSLWYYIVFMTDNTKLTNTKLAEFWDCFDIPKGNLEPSGWVGKVGGCRVKHEQRDGQPQAKIAYLISKQKQDKLPAWVEPSNKASYTGADKSNINVAVDDEFPFV